MAVPSETYDAFISYSRADSRHAADVDSAMRANGLKPFFDRRYLASGLPWIRALEQAIGAAKSAVVLIGPSGLGNTQQYERELALFRQSRDPTFPVIPVLLPDTRDPPFTFLQVLTWIDFSQVAKVSDAPPELQRLLAAVRGEATPRELRDAVCPYRGLDAFREEDAAFFFGRGNSEDPTSAIGQLVQKVGEDPFTMVVGRSGSGKSSLVNAGLLPALRREPNRLWNVLTLRPGPAPLRTLAAAFNPRTDEGAAEYASKITTEAESLRTGDPQLLSYMIREALDRAEGKPDRLLLYVDQWEELYTQGASGSDVERAAQHAADVNRFIELILTASRTAPVSIVGTVRADFYDPLIAHQELRSLLLTRQVLLAAMPRQELERTIVGPAEKTGLTFDPPDLVQLILDETGTDEGTLPLLQYALKETWALRKGNAMTGDSYARSGGVREAIRITAERAFSALSAEDQKAARQLFLRLVTPGEGKEDTRARAEMPLESAQRKIAEQFAGPRTRLLVTGWDRAKRPTVEVAHEALIRTWPRLRTWIDANREKLRARAVVLQAKADWEESGRRDDMLLPSGLQLERARALVADSGDISIDDIKDFIQLSSEREQAALNQIAETQRRQVRIRTFALVGVSALAVLAAVLGLTAERQRILAEEQKKQADDILAGITNFFIKPVEGDVRTEAGARAGELFKRGADRGDTNSMYMLGQIAANGWGKEPDYAKAREWYEKAAARGNKVAMVQLGWLAQNGWGVPRDYAKAYEWYEKAANGGYSPSVRNIGFLYQNGFGVPRDYAKAREWYEKAVSMGDTQAMGDLGLLYLKGWGVAQDYTMARAWSEKAAAKGDSTAMNQLGVMSQYGLGTPQDYDEARNWYEKAIERDDDNAKGNIGFLYLNGWGVARDYKMAREWFEKAAARNNSLGMNGLGLMFQNGWATPQDYDKARGWYEKAAEQNNDAAQVSIGLIYQNGWGVAQNYTKAREWFEKAAEQNNDAAQISIGFLYLNGWGIPQDYTKAREWFEKAAKKGNEAAKQKVEELLVQEAVEAGRYTEALQHQEALAARAEATETKRDGKPGKETGAALTTEAWYAVLARDFAKALYATERAHGIVADDLAVETNRAHALMFLNRSKEAEELYLAYRGKPLSEQDHRLWEVVVAEDFAELRRAGLDNPMMAQIEKKFGTTSNP